MTPNPLSRVTVAFISVSRPQELSWDEELGGGGVWRWVGLLVEGLCFRAFDKRDAVFLLTGGRLSCPPESLSSRQPGPAVCGELIEYRCRR